jgi:hypothetical protein
MTSAIKQANHIIIHQNPFRKEFLKNIPTKKRKGRQTPAFSAENIS